MTDFRDERRPSIESQCVQRPEEIQRKHFLQGSLQKVNCDSWFDYVIDKILVFYLYIHIHIFISNKSKPVVLNQKQFGGIFVVTTGSRGGVLHLASMVQGCC